MNTRSGAHAALRLVALFEAAKGLLVLAAGCGLLLLVHKDVHTIAATLIEHLHLNPASKLPRIFVDAADHLADGRLRWLALGAAAYAGLRLAEAYGLYRGRAWAEVLAAASGGIYIPVELYEWLRQPSWLRAGLALLNLAIVALMLRALWLRRQQALRA